MTDLLDPDSVSGLLDTEDPHCEAMPGMQPHNFLPVIDVLGGTGVYLYCSQCGDYFRIDGTEVQQGTPPAPAGVSAGTATQPAKPSGVASLP